MDNSKLMIFEISFVVLNEILQNKLNVFGLPEDAKVISVFTEDRFCDTQSLFICVQSESFALLQTGFAIPRSTLLCSKRKIGCS